MSRLGQLFKYAKSSASPALENFSTEALASAIRTDPKPWLVALQRRGLRPAGVPARPENRPMVTGPNKQAEQLAREAIDGSSSSPRSSRCRFGRSRSCVGRRGADTRFTNLRGGPQSGQQLSGSGVEHCSASSSHHGGPS